MRTRRCVNVGTGFALAALCACAGHRPAQDSAAEGAAPDGWVRTEHAESFSVYLPPGLVEPGSQGIDTYVRHYTSEALDVLMDYGSASLIGRIDESARADAPGCVIDRQRIGDREAVLLRCAPVGREPARIVAEYPGDRRGTMLRLTVTVKDTKAAGDAAGIVESVRFFES